MRLMPRAWLALAAALAATSCGSDDDAPASAAPLSAADDEIAAVLYAGTLRTPLGFASDPPPVSYAQVTTYHIQSSQLAAPATHNHELCTDDWSTALAWSEEVAARANAYLDLVATETTARYFEFGRVPRGVASVYVRQRVFRCAYLDRSSADLAANSGSAGVLNARPIDAAALADLAEYLWQFTTYNNAGHAVIASESVLPGPAHVLTLASLERAVGGTSCDRVTLREWLHEADLGTGELEGAMTVLREFGVRKTGGTLVGC